MLQHVALAGIDLCSMKRRVRKNTHTHALCGQEDRSQVTRSHRIVLLVAPHAALVDWTLGHSTFRVSSGNTDWLRGSQLATDSKLLAF